MKLNFAHIIAYAVLLLLLTAGASAFIFFWPNKMLVRGAVVALSISYVLWGCITHSKTQKFTWKVAEEYAAVAFLGGMLLILITFSVR